MKPLSKSNTFPRAALKGGDQCPRLPAGTISKAARGITHHHTMKIALSILLGVNAVIGLLILVLNQQL